MESLPLWPGWETVRLIGRGSFGTVYEIQRKIGGEVERAAVKVITIPQSQSDVEELRVSGYDDRSVTAHFEGLKDKIEREYMTMARLKGAVNIVYCDDIRIVQHDENIGWDIYLKMELLTPLLSVLSSPVDESQVIKLGKDICRALVMCEQANVVHRDIKPQNIFVAKDGTYKLGDFGVAKTIEGTGSASVRTGTFRFMAPEVYNGEHYGHKADLYSFGMVLYWLLNECRSPFLPLPPELPTEKTESAAKQRRFSGEALPAPAHGREKLKRIVLKACAYDPKDRYQSAEEMLRDLNALTGEGTDVPHAPVKMTEGLAEIDGNETVSMHGKPSTNRSSDDDSGATVGMFEKNEEKQPIEDAKEEKTVGAFDRKPEPKPEPKPKPKTWPVIVCGLAAVLVLAALAYFVPGWTLTTCETPETHRLFGFTRGDALGHQWIDPSCTEPSVCSVCGESSGEALGHDWGEPTYAWSSDNSSVTAKRVCQSDASHVETETVNTTSAVTTAATCTETGKTTYTASFQNSAFTTQTKTVENVAALGHEWVDATYEKPKTCVRCGVIEGQPKGVIMTKYTGDLASFERVYFSDATASSVYSEGSGLVYKPTNAIRDDASWPWVEGDAGDGTGENLILSFADSETIDLLGLHLGFASVYAQNNRPRLIQLDFSDGSSVQYEFEDYNQMQYVQLNHPITTYYIRLTILSVYPGNRDNDACISAVRAYRAK